MRCGGFQCGDNAVIVVIGVGIDFGQPDHLFGEDGLAVDDRGDLAVGSAGVEADAAALQMTAHGLGAVARFGNLIHQNDLEGLFKNAACVPTTNGVKTAESLYNTFDGNGKENLSSYVNQLEKGCEYRAFGIYESFKDQQNESIEYPNPIRDLDFLGKLSKDHCFEYLLNSKVDNTAKRRYVLSLLLEYHTAKEITEDDLQTYHKSSSANW